MSPSTPNFSFFTISHLCQTLSKAPEMSKVSNIVSFQQSSVSCHLVVRLSIKTDENLPFRNPYCLLLIRLLVSKNVVISFARSFSYNFSFWVSHNICSLPQVRPDELWHVVLKKLCGRRSFFLYPGALVACDMVLFSMHYSRNLRHKFIRIWYLYFTAKRSAKTFLTSLFDKSAFHIFTAHFWTYSIY